ncbi:MAG: polyprenyl synthetase family protein, partial [Chloroflexi bacterium]|nr:polyprenyl synthetase family protein [Chloroflexota bacterium]
HHTILGDDSLFYPLLQYHMGWMDKDGHLETSHAAQGKLLRPVLCLFACDALGADWTTAVAAGAALESVHSFSLIHDDIQDGDTERHHRATLWYVWGRPKALVAGNALRSLADIVIGRLMERGFPPEKVLRASHLLTRGSLDMIQGQYLDLSFEVRLDVRLRNYLAMIALKTGSLIRCSMELGALLASEEEAAIRSFAQAGRFLGLAFQIRDDVLGIWGDESATGKGVGNDIQRKKKSFPVVFALERASDSHREILRKVYSKPAISDQDAEQVLGILDNLGAQAYAHQRTQENVRLALAEMEKVQLPSWARQEAADLAEFLVARQF